MDSVIVILMGFLVGISIIGLAWVLLGFSGPYRVDRGVEDRCEKCGYDLRGGVHRCPECGSDLPIHMRVRHVPLRDEWPATEVTCRAPLEGERSIIVFQTQHPVQADLLRQQLTARGILCVVHGLEGQISPVTLLRSDVTYSLTVWSGDEALARDTITYLLQPPTMADRPVIAGDEVKED